VKILFSPIFWCWGSIRGSIGLNGRFRGGGQGKMMGQRDFNGVFGLYELSEKM
jgi:hypothetical protein